VLEGLHATAARSARYWWCWADYADDARREPPFDRAPHELRFGITRADGTLKPVAETLADVRAREGRTV
jgi:endo-1,4-beta-mannosidase